MSRKPRIPPTSRPLREEARLAEARGPQPTREFQVVFQVDRVLDLVPVRRALLLQHSIEGTIDARSVLLQGCGAIEDPPGERDEPVDQVGRV